MYQFLIIAYLFTLYMILHLVINCDPCVDHQIHTYLIIACISDISVKSDLKFYFMGICKDINNINNKDIISIYFSE